MAIKFKDTEAGCHHSIALDYDGSVWVWGLNEHGQLGTGDNTDRTEPVKLMWFEENNIKVKKVAAGECYSGVLTEAGDVYTFGCNDHGQLGVGDFDARNSPVKVKFIVPIFIQLICEELTVKIEHVGAGTTSPDEGIYTYPTNTTFNFNALSTENSIFLRWEVDKVAPGGMDVLSSTTVSSLSSNTVLNSDQDITAYFLNEGIHFTMARPQCGSVDPLPGSYLHDINGFDLRTISAIEDTKYNEFLKWEIRDTIESIAYDLVQLGPSYDHESIKNSIDMNRSGIFFLVMAPHTVNFLTADFYANSDFSDTFEIRKRFIGATENPATWDLIDTTTINFTSGLNQNKVIGLHIDESNGTGQYWIGRSTNNGQLFKFDSDVQFHKDDRNRIVFSQELSYNGETKSNNWMYFFDLRLELLSTHISVPQFFEDKSISLQMDRSKTAIPHFDCKRDFRLELNRHGHTAGSLIPNPGTYHYFPLTNVPLSASSHIPYSIFLNYEIRTGTSTNYEYIVDNDYVVSMDNDKIIDAYFAPLDDNYLVIQSSNCGNAPRTSPSEGTYSYSLSGNQTQKVVALEKEPRNCCLFDYWTVRDVIPVYAHGFSVFGENFSPDLPFDNTTSGYMFYVLIPHRFIFQSATFQADGNFTDTFQIRKKPDTEPDDIDNPTNWDIIDSKDINFTLGVNYNKSLNFEIQESHGKGLYWIGRITSNGGLSRKLGNFKEKKEKDNRLIGLQEVSYDGQKDNNWPYLFDINIEAFSSYVSEVKTYITKEIEVLMDRPKISRVTYKNNRRTVWFNHNHRDHSWWRGSGRSLLNSAGIWYCSSRDSRGNCREWRQRLNTSVCHPYNTIAEDPQARWPANTPVRGEYHTRYNRHTLSWGYRRWYYRWWFRFIHYNTQKNGRGEVFTPNYLITQNMTVYAQWQPLNHYRCLVRYNYGFGHRNYHERWYTRLTAINRLPGPPRRPYSDWKIFKEWNTSPHGNGRTLTGEEVLGQDLNCPFVHVYAIWRNRDSRDCLIYFDENGGDTSARPNTRTIRFNYSFSLGYFPSSPTRHGYQFMGWSRSANSNNAEITTSTQFTSCPGTLYAVWGRLNSYDVYFHGNGADIDADPQVMTAVETSFGAGKTLNKLPIPPFKLHHIFQGWSTSINGPNNFNQNTIIYSHTTVYARWKAAYNIYFNDNGADVGPYLPQTAVLIEDPYLNPFPDFIDPPAPHMPMEKNNYHFIEWNTRADGTGIKVDELYEFTKDTTLYAKWIHCDTHTVTFDSNGCIFRDIDIETREIIRTYELYHVHICVEYEYLNQNRFPENPFCKCQRFLEWNTERDGSGLTFTHESLIESNITVYAIFEDNHTITFDENTGDSNLSIRKDLVYFTDDNTYIKSTCIPTIKEYLNPFPVFANLNKQLHIFKEWNTQSDGLGIVFDLNYSIDSDITVYAIWADPYECTFDGTTCLINFGIQKKLIRKNSIINNQNIPNVILDNIQQTKRFVGWNTLPNGMGAWAEDNFTVTENTTFYAICEDKPTTYRVVYDKNGGDIDSIPNTQYVVTGTTVGSLPINPEWFMHIFTHWNTSPDGTGTIFDDTTIVNFNITVYAQWRFKSTIITDPYVPRPELPPGMQEENIIHLALGKSHAVALDYFRRTWAWGKNLWGQVGYGHRTDQSLPLMTILPVIPMIIVDNISQRDSLTNVTINTIVFVKQAHLDDIDVGSLGAGYIRTNINTWKRIFQEEFMFHRYIKEVFSESELSNIRAPYVGVYAYIVPDEETNFTGAGYQFDGTSWVKQFDGPRSPSKFRYVQNWPTSDPDNFQAIDCTFIDLDAGGEHTVGVDQFGRGWAWGGNQQCQLGIDDTSKNYVTTPTPMRLIHDEQLRFLKAGDTHTLGVTVDNKVYVWGNKVCGQGLPEFDPEPDLVPTDPDIEFVRVWVGNGFNIALDQHGDLWSWGENNFGQLGLGHNIKMNEPTKIESPEYDLEYHGRLGDVKFRTLDLHTTHVVAIDTNGELWAWGRNNFGQLGCMGLCQNGDFVDSNIPNPVTAVDPKPGHTFKVTIEYNTSFPGVPSIQTVDVMYGRLFNHVIYQIDGKYPAITSANVFVNYDGVNLITDPISADCHIYITYVDNQPTITCAPQKNIPPRFRNVITGLNHSYVVDYNWVGWCWGNCPDTEEYKAPTQNPTSEHLQTLHVRVNDKTKGRVRSEKINCGSTCTGQYTMNADVELLAQPVVSNIFRGWAIDDHLTIMLEGQGTCTIDRIAFDRLKVTVGPNTEIDKILGDYLDLLEDDIIVFNDNKLSYKTIYIYLKPSTLNGIVDLQAVNGRIIDENNFIDVNNEQKQYSFAYNTNLNLTAIPDTDYQFIRWSIITDVGDPIYDTSNPINITVQNPNINIYAEFQTAYITTSASNFSSSTSLIVSEPEGLDNDTTEIDINRNNDLQVFVVPTDANSVLYEYNIENITIEISYGAGDFDVTQIGEHLFIEAIPHAGYVFDEWQGEYTSIEGSTVRVRLSDEPRRLLLYFNDAETIPTGDLIINILPSDLGGKWRIVGTDVWYNSGFELKDLRAGYYRIEFLEITGYRASQVTVLIEENQTRIRSQMYIPITTGSLIVTTDQNTGWRIQGETNWRESGSSLILNGGTYTIEYEPKVGFSTSDDIITIVAGETTTHNKTYIIDTGSLTVTTEPIELAAGWRIQGETTWRESGVTIELDPGDYTIEYEPKTDYTATNDSVTVNSNQTTTHNKTYLMDAGSLTVTTEPVELAAGWRIQGETTWRESGVTIELDPGDYTIEYEPKTDYTATNDSVTVNSNQTTTHNKTYIIDTGSLTVTTEPIELNASWRIIE